MALPPLAEVSDLADWVGRTISDDDPRAGAVLSAASALVRSFVGLTWVDDTESLTEVPDSVAAIVVQVAARVWHNPSGAVSWTKGPFSERYSEGSVSSGLYLTDSEKEALSAFQVGNSGTGLGTISLAGGGLDCETIYVPTGPPPSGYPFPWYSVDDLP